MLRKILQNFPIEQSVFNDSQSNTLEQYYQQEVNAGRLHYDKAQHDALQQLQQLSEQLQLNLHYQNQSTLVKLRCMPPEKCNNLYLFGEVGGGKSLVMALFYKHCPISQKRRVHFNVFMLEVHHFIHYWQQKNNQTDALTAFAKQLRQSVLLLCFDEFHVSDIADAMILGRLFNLLFDLGVVVVITSNRHPNELYQGGIQREQFIFFIELLNSNSDIIELNAQRDYRLRHNNIEKQYYYFPLNNDAHHFIQQHYQRLTQNAALQETTLTVFGRQLTLTAVYNDILLSSFKELCCQPLAAADYLQLITRFNIVIIADIPQLTMTHRNEAKRLMTLIDILYEHNIKLICSAQVSANDLYIEGDGSFEFKRTVSRLMEMQSEQYMLQ